MTRSFAVDNIVPENVRAKFENGVLTVTMPKKVLNDTPRNKKIAIE
jgi:HSP20 family molecular chaperone IbpA